ncbi:hypothetical protein PR202_ga20712 [Eleusine coracana subsp. coracana]|uniref:Uncharacterized protein n=1 Tax=Eleusine coracana subsp. coracana TaxID=191504 RepID=A0AAV5CXD0_ELECO|nr:hypothetical protein PR202_ga20712 [Eleusine coracana subsp. coracana]
MTLNLKMTECGREACAWRPPIRLLEDLLAMDLAEVTGVREPSVLANDLRCSAGDRGNQENAEYGGSWRGGPHRGREVWEREER